MLASLQKELVVQLIGRCFPSLASSSGLLQNIIVTVIQRI